MNIPSSHSITFMSFQIQIVFFLIFFPVEHSVYQNVQVAHFHTMEVNEYCGCQAPKKWQKAL